MRLVKANSLAPSPCLYLFSIKCYGQKTYIITSEREARSEFLLIYTKNLSMSGRPAGRPAGRGHAFERLISLEP